MNGCLYCQKSLLANLEKKTDVYLKSSRRQETCAKDALMQGHCWVVRVTDFSAIRRLQAYTSNYYRCVRGSMVRSKGVAAMRYAYPQLCESSSHLN